MARGAYLITLDLSDLLLQLLVCGDAWLVQWLAEFGITGSTEGEGEARGHRRP